MSPWICLKIVSRIIFPDIQFVEHVLLPLQKILLIRNHEQNIWQPIKILVDIGYTFSFYFSFLFLIDKKVINAGIVLDHYLNIKLIIK